jgi:ATP-binding cassette subfamily B protein
MGMGMPVQKALDFKGSLRRFGRELIPERVRIIALLVLGVASVVLSVIGPKILGRATDVIMFGIIGGGLIGDGPDQFPLGTTVEQALPVMRAAGQGQVADLLSSFSGVIPDGIEFARLAEILFLVIGIYVGSFVFGWLQARTMTIAVQNTVRRLRDKVEAKLHRVPLSYVDAQQKGEILSRVTNDIDNVAQTATQTFAQLITSALTIIGVLIMMFSISWVLALVALVTVPLTFVLTQQIAKRSQPQFIAQWAATGRLNAHVEEMFTGHALVKVYGHQEAAAEQFATENEALYAASRKSQAISGTIMPSVGFIGNLNYVVIAVIGALRIASGTMTLGDVQAFIQYSRQFTQPITQVAAMMNLLQSGVASAERVYQLLDAPEQEPDPATPATIRTVQGRVAFEDVSFSYSPDKPLIEGLNLVAEAGQTVAIVGHTGAGKTTLVNLLMRFYEVDGGRITVDGVDTRAMTRDDLRDRIGMVLQDTWLFNGTIRENLMYGVSPAQAGKLTEEDFLAATRATFVDPHVRTLPDGYETVLDDEGAALSVGEKQLLTIARAFLSDPEILVLDEATSSVDTRTEVLVQHAMAALRSGRTSFVIAHRLSTIRDADTLVVMAEGRIVETGNHETLLAAGGAYAKLYQAQFAAPLADEEPAAAAGLPAGLPPDVAARIVAARQAAAQDGPGESGDQSSQ